MSRYPFGKAVSGNRLRVRFCRLAARLARTGSRRHQPAAPSG